MLEQILFAGFGGQGVLSMGKMIAEAAMEQGKNVSWFPAYGSEMRGGTSNCSVIITDDEVGSPSISQGTATSVVAMNEPSLEKFESYIMPGGSLFINSSITDRKATRTDIDVYYVPANEIATELKNDKVSNMVMLGAYIQKTKVVPLEAMSDYLQEVFGSKKAELVALNRVAIARGAEYAK